MSRSTRIITTALTLAFSSIAAIADPAFNGDAATAAAGSPINQSQTLGYVDGNPANDAMLTFTPGTVRISAGTASGSTNMLDVTSSGITAQVASGSGIVLRTNTGRSMTFSDTGLVLTPGTGVNFGGNRLQNVSTAFANTDAAQWGQVKTLVTTTANALDVRITATDARVTTLEDTVGTFDRRITAAEKKIAQVERKASAGVALASAMSQPVSFAPGADTAITGGVATFNGQPGFAGQYHRLLIDDGKQRLMLSAGAGVAPDGSMVRAGLSFSF